MPLFHPRLTASALVAAFTGALAACLAVWWLRLVDALDHLWGLPLASPAPGLPALCLAVSAAGAVLLSRPHARIRGRQALATAIGATLIVPTAALVWSVHARLDPVYGAPYWAAGGAETSRALARLLIAALTCAIVVLTRANLRVLIARSMFMRTGKIDRQPSNAVLAAVAIAAAGDIIHLASAPMSEGPAPLGWTLGTALIAVGSVLLTVGLAGGVIDALRLHRVLSKPLVRIADVVDRAGSAGASV